MRSSSLLAVTMALVETTPSRPYHLVIFGASGFTGQFVVEEVARTVSEGPKGTLKWAVAGRSKQKLEKVLEQAAGVLSMCLIPLVVRGQLFLELMERLPYNSHIFCLHKVMSNASMLFSVS